LQRGAFGFDRLYRLRLVLRKLDGWIELDPHIDSSWVIVVDEDEEHRCVDGLQARAGELMSCHLGRVRLCLASSP
jgi:hypothetical protein